MATHAQSKTVVFENDLDDDFVRILGILCKCAGAHAQRWVYFRGVLNLKKCINERDKSIRFGHDFCTVKLTRRENGENNNSKTF